MLQRGVVVVAVDLSGEMRLCVRTPDDLCREDLTDLLQHGCAVFVCEIHAELHPFEIASAFIGIDRQEGQIPCGIDCRMPFCIQRRRNLIEILPDDVAEMPAAGVEHDAAHAGFILLQFDEMVAAAERAGLEVSFIELGEQRTVCLIFLHLRLCAVENGGRLRGLIVRKTGRNIPQDAAADALKERAASGDCLPQELHGDVCLHKAHPAADINADCVGDDGTLTGDHTADRHTLARVGIGHQCDMLEREGQLCEMCCLLCAFFSDCFRIGLPDLDRQCVVFFHYKHGSLSFLHFVVFCCALCYGHSIAYFRREIM